MSHYEKKNNAELASALKTIGMSGSGDKGTLIHRLKMYDRCIKEKLVVGNNENPCLMKMSNLKKLAATTGIR